MATAKAEPDEQKIKDAFKEQLLLVADFKQEEIEKMSLDDMTSEKLQEVVRQRLLGAMVNNGNHQRVIPVGEVERYVANGWEFVAALPNDRAVLKLPN